MWWARAQIGHAIVLEVLWLMIVPRAPFFWLVMHIVAFAVVSSVGKVAVLGMMVCLWL